MLPHPPAAPGAHRPPRSPRTLRLFLALWPPPATLRTLRDWQARWPWPERAVVVPAERLHLTLHFLGAVPEDRLDALRAALTVPFAPFELQLDCAQVWPRGVAVMCPRSVAAPLAALQAQLGDALRAFGRPVEERLFRPHLSLARKACGATPPAAQPVVRWTVRSYALVRSRMGYETLQRYPARPTA